MTTNDAPFQLLFTEGYIDIFRRGNSFWWQHKSYREDDGFFSAPVNGPYERISTALKDAEPFNIANNDIEKTWAGWA